MTSKTPRQLTKVASGGDSLYAGLLRLWKIKKNKVSCFTDNPGLETAETCQVGGLFKTKQSKRKQWCNIQWLLLCANGIAFAVNNLDKQMGKKILTRKI